MKTFKQYLVEAIKYDNGVNFDETDPNNKLPIPGNKELKNEKDAQNALVDAANQQKSDLDKMKLSPSEQKRAEQRKKANKKPSILSKLFSTDCRK